MDMNFTFNYFLIIGSMIIAFMANYGFFGKSVKNYFQNMFSSEYIVYTIILLMLFIFFT